MSDPTNELMMEQYKLLHQEVMSLVAETRNIEVVVIGGIGGLYAWLAGKSNLESPVAYVGTALAIFGCVRALGLFRRIGEISDYMRKIEETWPTSGWETHLKGLEADGKCFPLRWVAVAVWAAILIMSLLSPSLLQL